MVNQAFEYIGVKMKVANPWLDTFAVNCIELPTGNKEKPTKRIVDIEGGDKEDRGISDVNGTGFYIKIDPIFTYTPQRPLSSSSRDFLVTINFRFLFFQINCDVERKKITLENLFTTQLRTLNFNDYTGEERQIKLDLVRSNIDALAIFKQEIGKNFESGADMILIAVDGKLSFLSTNSNCESDCGVSTSENLLNSYDFCNPSVFALLSEAQKVCLTEQLEVAQSKYKSISFTGDIDGVNTVFVASEEVVQIFKDGQLLFEGTDYTLSADKKTATLLVAPSSDFGNALKFFGNTTT